MKMSTSASMLAAIVGLASVCSCGVAEQGSCLDPNAAGSNCTESKANAFSMDGYKLVWQNGSQASVWKLTASADLASYKVYDAGAGWTPVSYSFGTQLWKHTSGKISLWTINAYGDVLSKKEYGPYTGYSVVNYSYHHILWKDTANNANLWALDDNDNNPRGTVFPSNGYVPTWFENSDNAIVWTDSTGQQIKLSYLNYNSVPSVRFEKVWGPYATWTPVNFDNSTILWKDTNGQASVWHMDLVTGNLLSYSNFGPFATWTPAKYFEREILWKDTNGQVSLWNMNDASSNVVTYKNYGPYAGWNAIDMTY